MAQFVEALLYKPEGRGFDSLWCHWNFSSHDPSGRSMAVGSTWPLTEIVTGIFSVGVRWLVRRAHNLVTFLCRLS